MNPVVLEARRTVQAARDALEVLGPDATDDALEALTLAFMRDAQPTEVEHVTALVARAEGKRMAYRRRVLEERGNRPVPGWLRGERRQPAPGAGEVPW